MHNYEKLLNKIRYNEVVLWVGAGFSKYAGVPMGGELTERIKSYTTPSEKELLKYYCTLPEVAEEFVKMRNNKKTGLFSIIKSALKVNVNISDLYVHNSLKNIPQIRTIITTNFDDLFEKAYGNDIEVIIRDESIAPAFSSINSNKVKLFKIHSDFTNPDLLIITKSDYVKFFDDDIYRPLWTEIKSIIAKKSIFFVGYSLEDANIQFIFNNIVEKLGQFSNECFLASPQLPEYKQNNLSIKNISYIPMSAEEIIPKLEKDIKDKLIEDCGKGLIDYISVKKVFENEGVKLDFQICEQDTYLSSIDFLRGNADDVNMNVSISFENNKGNEEYINIMKKLYDFLNGKSFEPITIPGEFIKGVDSRINGYNTNSVSQNLQKFTSFHLSPHPEEEYAGHLYFQDIDKPENVILKRYASKYLRQIEISHKSFKIVFKFSLTSVDEHHSKIEDIKLNIQWLKPSDIFEGSKISKLLLKWLNGEKVSLYKADDYNIHFDLPNISVEKDNLKELLESIKLQEYVYSNLIKIQRYYHVNFTAPDYISYDDIDIINRLSSIVKNNGKLYIKELPISDEKIISLDNKEKRDVFEFDIAGEDDETIELFGTELKLGRPHIYCNDAYIEGPNLASDNQEKNSLVIIKSKSENLFIEYKKNI
jgi:hypothetical protein